MDYPARYAQAVAVSAIGLIGSWPAGTYLAWTLSASRGKPLERSKARGALAAAAKG